MRYVNHFVIKSKILLNRDTFHWLQFQYNKYKCDIDVKEGNVILQFFYVELFREAQMYV